MDMALCGLVVAGLSAGVAARTRVTVAVANIANKTKSRMPPPLCCRPQMARHAAPAKQRDGRYGITLPGRLVGIVSAVAVEAEPSPAEWQNA